MTAPVWQEWKECRPTVDLSAYKTLTVHHNNPAETSTVLTRVLDSVEEMQSVKLEITYLSAFVMPALLEIHFQVVRGQLKDQ